MQTVLLGIGLDRLFVNQPIEIAKICCNHQATRLILQILQET